MKKQEVIDLASRRGLCVYEQYKGRKVYYKVRIPVFEDEKEIPTSYRDELVRNISAWMVNRFSMIFNVKSINTV